MDARAAEFLGRDVFAEYALDNSRAGQSDEGLLALDHERALARQVRAAARVVAKHETDRRHDPADLSERRKGLGVTVKPADACRNEGARGVVHADQWHALLARHVDEACQLGTVRRIHGPSTDGEIMSVDRDRSPIDIEDARHDRRAVEFGSPVSPEDHRLAFGEDLDSLPDRHAVLGMLDANSSGTATGEGLLDQRAAHFESGVIHAGRLDGSRRISAVGSVPARACRRRRRCCQGIVQGVLGFSHGSLDPLIARRVGIVVVGVAANRVRPGRSQHSQSGA
jgi:hypothetical protein